MVSAFTWPAFLAPCDYCEPTSEPQAASSGQNPSDKAGDIHSLSEEFTTTGENQTRKH